MSLCLGLQQKAVLTDESKHRLSLISEQVDIRDTLDVQVQLVGVTVANTRNLWVLHCHTDVAVRKK